MTPMWSQHTAESYKQLGFNLHVIRDMTFGTNYLIARALKAVYATQ